MNDSTAQNNNTSPESYPPPPKHPCPAGRGLAKLGMVVGGTAVLAILILAIVMPALAGMQLTQCQVANTTRVRGIAQGRVTFTGNNSARLPGTNNKGYLIRDVDGPEVNAMPATKHGGTVEGRYWLMLDSNIFGSEYIISPCEEKTAWTTGELSASHYSYALLNIHSDKGPLPHDKVRPDQTGRAREWRKPTNAEAVLVADRAQIAGGRIGNDYDKIYSIHTSEESEYWAGSVGLGDGSASFLETDKLDARYDGSTLVMADRLFSLDQDSGPGIDVISNPDHTWDVKSNTLLGYTSVGYEDDDIASD